MGGYAVRTAVGDVGTVVRVPKLEVRVSGERLAWWRAAAGEASLSAWVRDACDRAAGGGVAVADVQRPAVPVVRRGERDRLADAAVAALQGFGELPAGSAPPVERRPVPPVVPSDPRQSMTMQEVMSCQHPDAARKSVGYMTVCQACGRRQQGDGWVGEGYAAWTPGDPERAGCPRHPSATRSALD